MVHCERDGYLVRRDSCTVAQAQVYAKWRCSLCFGGLKYSSERAEDGLEHAREIMGRAAEAKKDRKVVIDATAAKRREILKSTLLAR